MQPTIGRIVHYTLAEQDVDAINRRRADFGGQPDGPGNEGFQGHVGNHARAGDVYPAMIVRVFDPRVTTANLQVFLDGNDTYWATSRTEGEGPCHWSWPVKVSD